MLQVNEEIDSLPPKKKLKIDDHEQRQIKYESDNDNQHKYDRNVAWCTISRLKEKQYEIYKRLSTFHYSYHECINICVNEIIPINLSLEILLFSGHRQIQNLWLSTFHKLKQFAFCISNECTLQEIQSFEQKYKAIFGDKQFEIPSDLRVSLMLCNSIQMPKIFSYGHGDLETALLPLKDWQYIKTDKCIFDSWRDVLYELILSEGNETDIDRLKQWIEPTGSKYEYILEIGLYNTESAGDVVFINLRDGQILTVSHNSGESAGPCGGSSAYIELYSSFDKFMNSSCLRLYCDTGRNNQLYDITKLDEDYFSFDGEEEIDVDIIMQQIVQVENDGMSENVPDIAEVITKMYG